MRVVLTIGFLVIALAASTLITAQTRSEQKNPTTKKELQPKLEKEADKKPASEKSTPALTSRTVLARLQLEIDTQPYQESMKFKDFLTAIGDELRARDKAVTIDVDLEAFANITPDAPNPLEQEISLKINRKRATVLDLLNLAVKQFGGRAAYIVRAGRVDILPTVYTSKEYMFNQTIRADFKDQRLDLALEELSDLTGVSIVLDPRAREKAKTSVTARFNDDVAMQDALRMLTEMGELKIVYLVTGMYVTTPEHARAMQKELKDLYESKTPASGAPMDPNMFGPMDPSMSPLSPPLPPGLRGKRLEAAA